MLKVLELFGGISAVLKALNNLNINYLSDYVEFDSKIVDVRNKLFNTNEKPINILDFKGQLNKYDLIIGGFPCQDISQGGSQKGALKDSGTRSSLIWEQLRIIKETLPNIVIVENVANLTNKQHLPVLNEYLKEMKLLGYSNNYEVLNTKDFGIPQNRKRIFIISQKDKLFNFSKLEKKEMIPLKYYLDFENDKTKFDFPGIFKEYTNFYVLPRKKDGDLINGCYNRVWKYDKYVGTIAVKMAPRVKIDNYYRELSNLEMFKLMGWNEDDFNKVKHFPKTLLQKVCGNSITINVLEVILKELLGGNHGY